MARPQTGTLYWTKSGWHARLSTELDGERVRQSFDLQTASRGVARLKLKRLLASAPEALTPTAAQRAETFQEAAERLLAGSTIRSKENRRRQLQIHAMPALGPMPVDAIRAADVRDVLSTMVEQGLSRQSVVHVRNAIGFVLGELWRAEALAENVCARVRIPAGAKIDRRERAVLTDDELVRYLAWQHPRAGASKTWPIRIVDAVA